MPLFSTKFESLQDLLVEELQDLYDAEQRFVQALPKMAEAASNPQLQSAFQHHLTETERQVERLENAFELIGEQPKAKTCEAMKGLISEGREMISAKGDDAVRDAALIAAAQRVAHYQIAAYGSARTFARRLGHDHVAELLQQTLNEEAAADEKLTAIAEESVNLQAQHA